MITNPDGNLHIYMVNVGQGDSTIIVSPEGNVILIDAHRGAKLVQLLRDLNNNSNIEHLIITHPHSDHFGGGNRVASSFTILEATLAPYWHEFGMGPATYRRLVGRLDDQDTNCTFLSGYSRWFPDGAMKTVPGTNERQIDPDKPFLELVGPTNGLVGDLEEASVFNTNHLSIMSRLRWRNFRMISAGDAQLENWHFFDRERLMNEKCQVLRTAHHGSSNGTQWERVDRLSPSEVIISSAPSSGHELPDLASAAVFTKYNHSAGRFAVITEDTGTIHLQVESNGTRTYRHFHDSPTQNVDLTAATTLDPSNNPSDWQALLLHRINDL